MFEVKSVAEFLMIVIAAFLAVAFDWIPGLAAWFYALTESKKRQLMIALMLAFSGIFYLLVCVGWVTSQIACSQQGVADMMKIFLQMVAVNQGTHALFKPAKSDPITWPMPIEG